MHCLLIAATAFEIAPFIESARKRHHLYDAEISPDILITGVGLVASTYAITKHLSIKKPGIIIQAGIGGCFDKNIPLSSVVAIRQDRVADLGVIENNNWKTLFDLGFAKPGRTPYSNGWLINRSGLLKTIKLPKVTGISVNEISTSPKKIKFITEKFNPVVESLEGAALHHVAISENIPFVQLRAMSNYIGERNKKKWQLKQAINNLDEELKKLLQSLNPV